MLLDAGSGFANYHWSNGASTQTTNVNIGGTGTVNCSVTVMDSYGCSASDALQITFTVCSGVATINSDYPWSYVYPNPFTNNFKIFSEKKLQVKIFDVSGRLVEENKCEGTLVTGQNLSLGIYFVDVYFNNVRKTYKVMKAQ